MSHLTCNSRQVLKTQNTWKVKHGNRPKGITDEEWAAIRKEDKLNKLIVLNKVPKASRSTGPKRADKE
jgi:hypothetical protein